MGGVVTKLAIPLQLPVTVPVQAAWPSGARRRSILQKKWTSFLKARLICHIPQYETLRGVCSLDTDTSSRAHFYAAFTLTTQWSVQGQWGGRGKELGTA